MTLYARAADGSVRMIKDIFNGLPSSESGTRVAGRR